MPDVTFVIPVAPYHATLVGRALASVKAQTVPCEFIVIHDEQEQGPAWARNRGLARVQTPFVVFLDADDWVEPLFVERCLEMWEPRRYVYTDWYAGERVHRAPASPWCDDLEWHVVTALLPKYACDEIAGFKSGYGEDTEFYWGLTRRVKCCGLALHEPLFHYGSEGRRAREFLDVTDDTTELNLAQNPKYQAMMREVIRSYGNMGCCSDQIIKARESLPEGEPGDVMARAIWGGNRQVMGSQTGRLYPRNGNGRLMPVALADAQAAPHLWQIVDPRVQRAANPPQPPPMLGNTPMTPVLDFEGVLANLFPDAKPQPPTLGEMQATPPAETHPDVQKVSQLTRRLYD